MSDRTVWETIEGTGEALIGRLKEIVTEGNVRRVRIRQKDHVIAEFPLTVGVVGALFAPVLAAIGAIAALAADCTIELEKASQATTAAPDGDTAASKPM